MPLSVALLVMIIMNDKEIHGAPFEPLGRRERLTRGDRDRLGGVNEPGSRKYNRIVKEMNVDTWAVWMLCL